MKVALVHDYLIQMGGAERVVALLHELFPDAPIYTSVCRKAGLSKEFKNADIRTSFLQKFPLMGKEFRLYFMLYPWAFSSFDLSEYDLIISSSSAYAKGIRKKKGQIHVCYCHTPMRFVWRYEDYIKRQGMNPLITKVLSNFMAPLRGWDLKTVENVDHFIANSSFVAKRIKSIYKRDSVIIFPPVDTERFRPSKEDGDYFLVVSRLKSYKRIDLAVEVFSKLELPLKIVGEGPAAKGLKRIAGPSVEFLGHLPDEEVGKLYAGCRALVFPGEEDFGITPLEAAASGRPTIAYRGGGAEKTIIDGKTGVFFDCQDEGSLARAVERFGSFRFNKDEIAAHAKKFSKDVFKERIMDFLHENKIL